MAFDGGEVARRLDATPGVQRVPNRALGLFVMRAFLDPARCASLCRMIDERRRPSDISDHKGGPDFRTSETCDFALADPLVGESEEGGATCFKEIKKTIQPEVGKLVAWNSLLPDGSPNPATLHQGMKVRRGTKYIITKWFREYAVGGA